MGAPPIVDAPTRPDVPVNARRPSRGGWATIAVVGTILAVVLGGYVVAATLSEPVGQPVGIPGVVSIRPLSGWVFAGSGALFSGGRSVQLTRGSGNLVVTVREPYRGDPHTLARMYRDSVLSEGLSRLSVSLNLETVRLRTGLLGVRFVYVGVIAETGTSVEGEVTVVVTPSGHGIIFDAWAPAGLLSFVRSDVRAMVTEAAVT
ncbi:MAG: hypothetical protein ACXWEJ_08435 [Actinomycetota bacterium]